jgi:hypothetical protein
MPPVADTPTPIADPLPRNPPAIAAKDKKAATHKRLEAVYAVVRDDLLADFRRRNMPEESIEYYRRVRTSSHTLTHMLLFSFLPIRPDDRPTVHGLQCPRWKAQQGSERRRLGRYP